MPKYEDLKDCEYKRTKAELRIQDYINAAYEQDALRMKLHERIAELEESTLTQYNNSVTDMQRIEKLEAELAAIDKLREADKSELSLNEIAMRNWLEVPHGEYRTMQSLRGAVSGLIVRLMRESKSDKAQIAMLREVLEIYRPRRPMYTSNYEFQIALADFNKALSATSSDSAQFVREKQAEALEAAATGFLTDVMDRGDAVYELHRMAAKKRRGSK